MADKINWTAYGIPGGKGREREDLIVMDTNLSSSTKTKGSLRLYPEFVSFAGIAEQDLMASRRQLELYFRAYCVC